MKSLRIALLQISPCGDTDKNLQKGLDACRAARAQGADIALFPEMWSNGYNLYGRPVDAWKAEAIPGDGAFVHSFGWPGSWIWPSASRCSNGTTAAPATRWSYSTGTASGS